MIVCVYMELSVLGRVLHSVLCTLLPLYKELYVLGYLYTESCLHLICVEYAAGQVSLIKVS